MGNTAGRSAARHGPRAFSVRQARTWPRGGWSLMWRSIGSTKASVLPLPVLATPMQSRPLMIIGSACACNPRKARCQAGINAEPSLGFDTACLYTLFWCTTESHVEDFAMLAPANLCMPIDQTRAAWQDLSSSFQDSFQPQRYEQAGTWMGMGSVMPPLRSASTTRLLRPHWFQLRTGRGTSLPRTCTHPSTLSQMPHHTCLCLLVASATHNHVERHARSPYWIKVGVGGGSPARRKGLDKNIFALIVGV